MAINIRQAVSYDNWSNIFVNSIIIKNKKNKR